MARIEDIVLRIYARLLRLYPPQFRQEFGDEMPDVFTEALAASRGHGKLALLKFLSNELKHLPGSLLAEHWQALRKKVPDMDPQSNPQSRGDVPIQPPISLTITPGWVEAFLATLPYILILILDGLPKLLFLAGVFTWESAGMRILNLAIGILSIIALLGLLISAWRLRWPLWSASWVLFWVLLVLWPLGWLFSTVLQGQTRVYLGELVMYLAFPLMVACVLYRVTRLDRLRGLLAALPVVYYLWLPNMEFVPDQIEVLIKAASAVMVSLAVMLVVRLGDWRRGVWIILATNLAVGLQFSYAGIYHGGTLPFVAQGPSPIETLKSFIPQYLATNAILMGPLLARMYRKIGLRSGAAGSAGYRLALLGLLAIIVVNLTALMTGTTNVPLGRSDLTFTVLKWLIYLSLGSYLIGLFLLYRKARRFAALPDRIETILLPILPLALPLALAMPFISWKQPISPLYGIPWLFQLPQPIVLTCGLLWLLLTAWLITRQKETPVYSLKDSLYRPHDPGYLAIE